MILATRPLEPGSFSGHFCTHSFTLPDNGVLRGKECAAAGEEFYRIRMIMRFQPLASGSGLAHPSCDTTLVSDTAREQLDAIGLVYKWVCSSAAKPRTFAPYRQRLDRRLAPPCKRWRRGSTERTQAWQGSLFGLHMDNVLCRLTANPGPERRGLDYQIRLIEIAGWITIPPHSLPAVDPVRAKA
jgi:hypothetical protein